MKKSIFATRKSSLYSFIVATLIFFTISETCLAQEEEPIYTIVGLMKVKQGGEANYVDIERSYWKPIHQELVKQGKILGWYLYRIQFTGTGDEYNYATVTHMKGDYNMDEGMYGADIFTKVHPKVEINEMLSKTLESRDLVSNRLLQWTLRSMPDTQREPNRYAVFNYQRSMPGFNYYALRANHVKPAFDLALKEGKIGGWGLWVTRFPSGPDLGYNWISADFFDKFDQIGGYGWVDIITRANPDIKNIDELTEKLQSSRTFVKTELWELVDYAR